MWGALRLRVGRVDDAALVVEVLGANHRLACLRRQARDLIELERDGTLLRRVSGCMLHRIHFPVLHDQSLAGGQAAWLAAVGL